MTNLWLCRRISSNKGSHPNKCSFYCCYIFFLRKKEKNQAKYHFAWVTILHFFVHIPHLNLLTISFTFLNCITIWIKIPFTSLSSLSSTAGLVRLHFSHLRPLVCRKKAFFESKSSRWNNAVTQRFLSIDFPPY